MTEKTTEQLLREQAEAVLKVQEEALKTQMQMMEQLYGDNPEMLAMMKRQIQQSLQNQSSLVAQAQTAAMQAVQAQQNGQPFDPQSLIQTLQNNAQAMGYGLDAQGDPTEGYDSAWGFIQQLQTDFTEPEAQVVPLGSKPARIFGYLLSGIVGNINGHELDQLAPEEHEPFFEEKVQTILREYWGITNTDELGERLSDLIEEGGMAAEYAAYAQAETFEEIAQSLDPEDMSGAMQRWLLARHFKDTVSPEFMRGWDIGRAAALVRWGYFVGMIDEQTAESILEVCAQEASARYSGWREFAESYLFGGLFWRIAAGEDAAADWLEDAGGACAELLRADGEWTRYPWVKAFA